MSRGNVTALQGDFFGFNPVPTRIALGVGATLCALLAATAGVRPALTGGGAMAWGIAAAYAVMALLFVAAIFRLRPRTGWGVTVGARVLSVSRPLFGAPIEVSINDLAAPARGRRDSLVLRPKEGSGHLVISRHLFPSRAAYHRMIEALEERFPRAPHDA